MNPFTVQFCPEQSTFARLSTSRLQPLGLRTLALLFVLLGLSFSTGRALTPVISGATSVTGTVGLSFAYVITASNTPTSYNATGLPSGVAIDIYTGVIWGTLSAAGTSTITLSATNASGTATAKLALTANPQPSFPVITSGVAAAARVSVPFSFAISASNAPTSYSATGLPPGLTIDTTHGVISGTATAIGTATVTLTAKNASGTGTSTLVLTSTAEMAKGADVGWLQQMDASGFTFYETNGQELDPEQTINCLKILRKRNIDMIRIRVLVPPITQANWDNELSGNCTPPEVTDVAAKAQALGFRILLDLHYSWTFADPGNQRIPVTWANAISGLPVATQISTIASYVSQETTEVLTEMKAAGVTPEFVQVGNEVTNGMLSEIQNDTNQPATKVSFGSTSYWPSLVTFINAGYSAIKAVDPNIKVVIHIDRAHSDSIDKGFFTSLQQNGGKWDVSATDFSGGTYSDVTQTMNDLAASFTAPGQGGAGVMMCEIEPPNIYNGTTYNPNPNFDTVTSILNIMRAVPGNKGIGAVYWEPEADPDWRGYLQSTWTNEEPSSALDSMLPSILQTSGLNIIDGVGTPFQLKGVNLGGLMVMEPWMTPADASGLPDEYSIISELDTRFGVTEEQSLIQTYRQSWITSKDFDNIKAQGLNVIRVPVWWGDFYALNALGATNPTMRTDAFTVLDSIVQTAAERGIRTIIDMHGVFGGQSASDDTGYQNQNQYWTNANDQTNTQLMWSAIAAHYNGNPWVAGYDLLNEPSGTPSNQAVLNSLSSLYTTVRAADPNHIIFMEGTWGNWNWSMLPNPATMGWTNVVYEMHEYQFSNETVSGVEAGADHQVSDFNSHKSYNVPAYIGEFNAFGTGTPAWQYVVSDFNNDGMSWSSWSYKATHGTGTDSWGLYNPTGHWSTVPNITTDSTSAIQTDWSMWTTANTFALNPMISTVIIGAASITSLPEDEVPSGSPFSYTITASDLPTSFTATGLPTGLTLNQATGVISGTPALVSATTVYNVALSATTSGGTVTGNLRLKITPPVPVITSKAADSAATGVAYSYQIVATNGANSYNASSLPAGLAINTSNGLISGTPTAAGTYNVTLSATNSYGTGTLKLVLTVTTVPTITSATTATGQALTAFSYSIIASNSPTTYNATPLPSGISVNKTSGLISGTPTAQGSYSIMLSASNISGTGTATLSLTINAAPPLPGITSATAASGAVGQAFNYILAASNSPTSYNATGLPPGLSINTTTGLITGSPTATGTYTVTLTATNAGGTGSSTFTVTINATTPSALVWAGATSHAWDVTTANWQTGGGPITYIDDSNVVFDDTGSGGTIALAGAYSPAALSVNSSAQAYAFTSPGSLNGSMALIKSGTSNVSLSSPNFYTGGTQILAGQLSVSGTITALGTGTLTFGASGDTSTATVRVAGLNLPNPIAVYPGAARWIEPGNGSAVTYTGLVTLYSGGTLSLSTVGGNIALSGGVVGTGNILFAENGGARGSSETVSGGAVNMVGTISDAGSPDTGGAYVSAPIGTNVTGITQGSATESLTLTGTNTYNGPITISSGTLTLGGAGVLGGGSFTGTIADSGKLVFSSTVAQTLSGAISGGGSINVNAGLLVLAGSDTYTGGTLVNSGTLVVTGSVAGSVSVSAGSTLSGTGTITGATSLNIGGILVPGSIATGTMTLSGGLQLAAGSSINFGLGASGTSSLVTLAGGSYAPPASGQVTVNVTALGGVIAGTYPLITGATGISASAFALSSVPSGTGFSYALTAGGSTLSLVVTPPPLVPANLAASASGAAIVLHWTASSYATSYTVGRATVSGGPYTMIASASAANFTDTAVTAGAAYYYVVSASNSAGTSTNSNQASATALTAFQQWLGANGLPVNTAPSAQPDSDGVSLLMKYATALTPGLPSAAGPSQISSSGDFLVLQFNRLNPPPVNYLVESSSDLVNWTSLASLATGATSWTGSATVTESGSNPVQVSVTDTASLAGGTSPRFLRMRTTTSTDLSEPSTVPMGDVPVTLTGTMTDATSVPLDNPPVARNAVTAVTPSSLTLVNAGSWAAAGSPYAVRMLSGHGSGSTFVITGQSGNALTLKTQGLDLTQLVAVGDLYEVLPLNTLASLFGPTAPLLQSGKSASTGDNVLVWNGTTWLTYYNNGTMWKQSGSLLSHDTTLLPPSGGLMVTRRGASAVKYQLIGRVPEVAQSQFTTPGGNTFLAGAYPIGSTLGTTGFAAASGWQSGTNTATVDNVLVWNGSTWLTFYYSGSMWKQTGSLLNENSYPLTPGQPLMIQRHSSPTPANAFVVQPLNYVP